VSPDFCLRKARESDIPFLILAIRSAESSGARSRKTTYEMLYSLNEEELPGILRNALMSRCPGHQLDLDSFYILEEKGNAVATCAAWMEAQDGVSSGFKLASIFSNQLGMKRWRAAKEKIQALAEAMPEKTPGTLQLETFFVVPEYRGRGLTSVLIESILAEFKKQGVSGVTAEIMFLHSNNSALQAYKKAGFQVCGMSTSANRLFLEVTGSSSFVQVFREIEI
jgi:GNAT superfamily N-acetyltransferase